MVDMQTDLYQLGVWLVGCVVRGYSCRYSFVAMDRNFLNCSQRDGGCLFSVVWKSSVERINDGLKQKELTNHGGDITSHQTSIFCCYVLVYLLALSFVCFYQLAGNVHAIF